MSTGPRSSEEWAAWRSPQIKLIRVWTTERRTAAASHTCAPEYIRPQTTQTAIESSLNTADVETRQFHTEVCLCLKTCSHQDPSVHCNYSLSDQNNVLLNLCFTDQSKWYVINWSFTVNKVETLQWFILEVISFKFSNLADAFIQSDLQTRTMKAIIINKRRIICKFHLLWYYIICYDIFLLKLCFKIKYEYNYNSGSQAGIIKFPRSIKII